jgi:hypothetical protein
MPGYRPVRGRPLPADFPLADRARIEALRRSDRLAARRGVWVPPELEAEWRRLKRKQLTNPEAARALGLIRPGNPAKEPPDGR